MGHVELSAKNCTSVGEASKGEGDGSMGRNSTRGKEDDRMFVTVMFTFYIGAIVFLILISCMGPSSSSIYIQDVYVPTLALDTNGTTPFNASIFVDLEFHREANVFDVFSEHHAEYEMVVFHRHGASAAGYWVPAFRMGRHTTVHRIAVAMEAPELPWKEALRAVSAGLSVDLVVEIGMVGSIQNGDHVLTAHVAVDASGHMVSEGPIEIGSARYIKGDN